ncbi:MAG: hypothetical protein IPM29_15345 [Planctomycetes bacterium]|nr:hypothetical protein [Planctomycetota bacterium]
MTAPDDALLLDEPEYARGRTIGRLERWLLLMLVIAEAYGALGFLVAAKGLLRMRDTDDRAFAEYVVVGTLASILVAAALGVFVRGAFG